MILVFVEHADGNPAETSLQALALARLLGDPGDNVHAVAVGNDGAATAEGLGDFGVAVLHTITHQAPETFAPGAWAAGVAEVARTMDATLVVAAGTDTGNEVMAHVAARLDAPMAANCIEATPGDPIRLTRMRWGGSLLEDAELSGPVKVLTVAPHAVPATRAPEPTTPTVHEVTPALSDDDLTVRVTGRVKAGGGGVSLADARVVVGGGRGVGGAEGFAPLEELARLLGGAVGCSRVATSLGWRPHADQVGQTGTRIAPDLYIACGISGAMQHIVGCRSAKHILAINTDPEAPMVTRADWAVIGDVHSVLPALIDAIHAAAGGANARAR